MLRLSALPLVAVALVACSGGSSTGTNNNTTATCAITITGAATANGDCTAAVVFSFAGNQTLFTVTIPAALGTVNSLTVNMVLKAGLPAGGLFTEVTAVSTEMDVLVGAQAWLTSRNIAGLTTQGTATLTLTDLGTEHTSTDGDKTYTGTAGTFDATAPFKLGTGATGTMTVHAIF